MKFHSGLGLLLVLLLVVSLMVPEIEGRSIRPHRGPIAKRGRAGGRGAGVRSKLSRGRKSSRKSKKTRRGKKKGRRGGRTEDYPDADVVTDDTAAASDPASAGGEGDVCEVLMFDRGDGTYSLKFIQNKC